MHDAQNRVEYLHPCMRKANPQISTCYFSSARLADGTEWKLVEAFCWAFDMMTVDSLRLSSLPSLFIYTLLL